MKIASHNSLTYYSVTKWWMKPIKWIAKCQDKNIYYQHKSGVNFFDFRFRFDNKGNLEVAHGPIRYNITYDDVLFIMSYLNSYNDIYVRVLLDARKGSDLNNNEVYEFHKFCYFLETHYVNIKFFDGRILYNYERVYNFKNEEPEYIERVGSVHKNWIWHICPKLYAKFNNKKIKEQNKDKEHYVLMDFI